MNYCGLNKNDIANGEGVRVSLFVSGCMNHCKGCHNPEAWDFSYGQPFTKETEDEMSGVTGAMVGAGGTTVVNNYNNDNSRTVNQTNNSPKSLSRLEIYRQTRNALNV